MKPDILRCETCATIYQQHTDWAKERKTDTEHMEYIIGLLLGNCHHEYMSEECMMAPKTHIEEISVDVVDDTIDCFVRRSDGKEYGACRYMETHA